MHDVLELLVRELDPARARRRPSRSRPRRASGSGSRPRPRTPCPSASEPRARARGSGPSRRAGSVTGPSQSIPSQRSERWICSVASATSRLVSVFSIRSRHSPPRPRAKSQLKRNVRTPPMWRNPVGLGAMRTRTLIGPDAIRGQAGLGAGTAADRRIAHTDGSEQDRRPGRSITPSASQSVSTTPIASASGPTSANPSGVSTNDPSASYELTRDCACSGTSRWKTVNQSVRWTAIPRPPTERRRGDHPGRRVQGERERAAGRRASRQSDAGDERHAWGRIAQGEDAADDGADPARGQDRRPRAGPAEVAPSRRSRPEHDPDRKKRFPIPKRTTDGPQPRARGELLPALAELVDEAVRASVAVARRDADAGEQDAAQTKATASIASAIPGLPATTITPPTAGPSTPIRFRDHPLQRVRLLESRRADGLRHETDLGRARTSAEPDAVDDLEADDRRSRRRSR